jgi:hypothetical protein
MRIADEREREVTEEGNQITLSYRRHGARAVTACATIRSPHQLTAPLRMLKSG